MDFLSILIVIGVIIAMIFAARVWKKSGSCSCDKGSCAGNCSTCKGCEKRYTER